MRRIAPFSCCVALLLISATPSFALYSVHESGVWPKSWPKQLEPLRKAARTLVGPTFAAAHHAIPFRERETFEAAWPHLLEVTTPGAPIVLKRGASFWLEGGKAGVCIHTPPKGTKPSSEAAEQGRLHETIYIELIVDGRIVDLNRLKLPPNTPMIDKRFEED